MKIIYVHTDPLPSPMAGSVFALSTAVGLAKAGHETVLIMPSAGKPLDQALAHYGIQPPDNLRIIMGTPTTLGVGSIRWAYSQRFYRSVKKSLAQVAQNADGIIVRTLKLAAFLSQNELPAPLIYEMHDWYSDVARKWSGAESMIPAKKLKREKELELLEKATMPRLGGAIVLRETTARLVRESYPDLRLATIPTGLDVPSLLPEVNLEPVVVYVGQLHPHKGLDVLFDALVIAKNLRLLVVGGGDWLSHWQQTALNKGLVKRVQFVGHVPKAQVPKYLAQGRVAVLPLLDCFFNRYLTSPLKIMEYYAAGLPVVTADAPVTAEVVEHERTGLLVPFGDARALAEALERLCLDPVFHDACRKNIAARLPDLSWTRRGEHIAEFFKQIKK